MYVRTFVVGIGVFVRALPTGFGQSLCYALIPLVLDVLQGGGSNQCIEIVVSPLTSLMMEQREVEQRGQSRTHEVCRRATTRSRHNRGWKKCTVLARRWISSRLRC